MSEQNTLSGEELDFIRHLYDTQLSGKVLHSHTFKVDGGPLANALLGCLGQHAQLSLEAQLGNYRMAFPLQLVEDEMHSLQLELGAPSIFEDGTVRRPWRLTLQAPLFLRDEQGTSSALQVLELSPASLLVDCANDEPPEHFSLWLPLPGRENLPIKGQLIRRLDPHRAAYSLHMQHREHVERLRQFIFEQYRQRHPQLQVAG